MTLNGYFALNSVFTGLAGSDRATLQKRLTIIGPDKLFILSV